MNPMFSVFSVVLIALEKMPMLLSLAAITGVCAWLLLRGERR